VTDLPSIIQVHEAKASVDTSDKRKAEQRKFGVFFDDDYDYLQHLKERGDSSHHVLPDELNESDVFFCPLSD
jgi:protein LTV1